MRDDEDEGRKSHHKQPVLSISGKRGHPSLGDQGSRDRHHGKSIAKKCTSNHEILYMQYNIIICQLWQYYIL